MEKNINCEWMSIKLSSPVVLASLTPMSNASIDKHIAYFKKVESFGAGAIILPSINPRRHGEENFNAEIVDTCIIDTHLKNNEHMAFAVLGPTDPNIVSVEYGCKLALLAKKNLNIPVIGSIAVFDNNETIVDLTRQLYSAGVDGLELNCSCPNVISSEADTRNDLFSLLKKIRGVFPKPISIKITPYQDYSDLFSRLSTEIDSVTLCNAYLGLVPPDTESENHSPFKKTDCWAPCGIYGPFERSLTYYKLYEYRELAQRNKWDIACSGGIVCAEDALQAIMLGANVIELSSGIMWKGISLFDKINKSLSDYINKNGCNDVSEIKGLCLNNIESSCNAIISHIQKAKYRVNQNKCKSCKICSCLDKLCFAFSADENGKVFIDSNLCSGCGWCSKMCINQAIELDE